MIGKIISHYKIVEKLGAGGMGTVYKARDTKLDRYVALKFLPPDLMRDDDTKKRFIQEAKAASVLQHKNICTIHEIDEAEIPGIAGNQMFICMDYYEGESLKKKLEKGPQKLSNIIEIASHIAQGLVCAHESNVIHRDIKSANVMIPDKGESKIVDFGLAKLAGQSKLTQEKTTIGTVAYMSPEQMQGGTLDHRTDIWSLGVVLYEMIIGQLPFRGEYESAVSYSILNEVQEPITALRTGVPMELERIVSKCLEKDPNERYQTAADLLVDLRHLDKITTSHSTLAKEQTQKFPVRKSTRRLVLISISILMAITALVILLYQLQPSEEQSDLRRKMLVVLPFENLGSPEDDYFADGITEEITSRLAALHDLGIISRTSAFQYKNSDKTIKEIGGELNVDYVLEGTVRWQQISGESRVRVTPQLIRVSDDTHLWSDIYDRILQDIFKVQSEIAGEVTKQLNINLLDSEQAVLDSKPTDNLDAYNAYLRGLEYMGKGNYLKEETQLAIQMFSRAIKFDSNFTLAFTNLSRAHSQMYHFGHDRTSDRLEKAKIAVNRAIELQPELPQAYRALGTYYYWGTHDFESALSEFSIALKDLPNDPDLLADIAFIWRRQGLWEKSQRNLEQVIKLNPKDHKNITQFGLNYISMREFDKAISLFDRSISLAPDQQLAYLLKSLSYVFWNGDLKNARTTLEDTPNKESAFLFRIWFELELIEGKYTNVLERITNLPYDILIDQTLYAPRDLLKAIVYDQKGDSTNAHQAYESARILLEEKVREFPDDDRIHRALGRTYAGLGQEEEAITEGIKALNLRPVSNDALEGPENILNLIYIYTKVGEYEKALEQADYLFSIPFWYSVSLFRIDPLVDPLRSHPRYQEIIKKYSGN
ncbi:protein kinase [Bacteroidota bacterium]